MHITIGGKKYYPGMYTIKKIHGLQVLDKYSRELDQELIDKKKSDSHPEFYPTICFSRKIGVGALEIAEILAEEIGYQVVDRELLMHIADQAEITKKTVSFFDERYPGKMSELIKLLFGEKSFLNSDYARNLFQSVLSIASMKPTIFVGRGTHLILPRDRVLAVRCISSLEHRVNRLSTILQVPKSEVEAKIDKIDKEQREFFKKVFGKKDASPYEFDIVINFDHIKDSKAAASIVSKAFKDKFGAEIETA